jgi:hypothetical protein
MGPVCDFIEAFLFGMTTIGLVTIQRNAQRLENSAICRLDEKSSNSNFNWLSV